MAEQSTTTGGFSNISMSTIIHVGIECVMIGGVVYLITSKTNALQDQITVLNDTIKKQNEQLTVQADLITKHENAIRQLYTTIQQIPINQQQFASQPQTYSHQERSQVQQNNENQNFVDKHYKPQQVPRQSNKQPSPQRQLPRQKKEKVIEEPQVQEIDDLLMEELNELNHENKECEDEGCIIDHSNDENYKTTETTSTFSKKKVH